MAKKNVQVEGQLCLEMCLNEGHFCVQHNNLITGRQALSLNAAKLLRAAIMQIVAEDEELKAYIVSSSDLASMLHISKDNIYRVMDEVSDELVSSYCEARSEYGERRRFKKINWVSFCEYDSDVGFALKLNPDMKPYLLGLKNNYTQYAIDNILAMKSVYGIRIFELLQEKIRIGNKSLPKNGLHVELAVDYIRECCDCEEKYERFSQFKARVLDRATEEINRVTPYVVTYDYVKKGRSVVALNFFVNTKYH